MLEGKKVRAPPPTRPPHLSQIYQRHGTKETHVHKRSWLNAATEGEGKIGKELSLKKKSLTAGTILLPAGGTQRMGRRRPPEP